MGKKISIITITTNDKKWLKKCFDSIFSQTYGDFEIILVDNNAKDGSEDFVKSAYPNIKIIKSHKNIGFSGGNNLGVESSTGEYVLLLNPDTWMKPDFLEKFVAFFESHDFDVLGTLEADYESGEVKNKNFYTRIDPLGHTISLPKKGDEEQFNICGFCMLTKKNTYIDSGRLDENFLIYVEEVDWCWRLRMMGKKVGLAEDFSVRHAGTAAGKKPTYFTFICRNRNIPQMLFKNYSWYNLLWVMPLYFVQNIFEIIFFLFTGKPKLAWSYVAGWGFVAKNFPRILKNRKWVQKKRIIGDWEIMKKYFYFGNAKFRHLISFYRN